MKTVIIGGVAAGMSTAARLRRLDENAEIMVLERDHYVSCANCGLTYHIGGEIVEREKLLIVTPDHLRTTLAIDVRTGYDVLAIDRATKEVTVRGRANGRIDRVYTESYDTLVLALGGEPIRPPVPGVDHPRIYTLRTILDMDRIKASVDEGARSAVVIGASYIGVEMVEALRQRGLTVDLVELQHLCLTKRWCRICVTTWSTAASRSTPLLTPEVCRRERGGSYQAYQGTAPPDQSAGANHLRR